MVSLQKDNRGARMKSRHFYPEGATRKPICLPYLVGITGVVGVGFAKNGGSREGKGGERRGGTGAATAG